MKNKVRHPGGGKHRHCEAVLPIGKTNEAISGEKTAASLVKIASSRALLAMTGTVEERSLSPRRN